MQQVGCSRVDRHVLYEAARLYIDEAIDQAEEAKADVWVAEEAAIGATGKFQKKIIQGTVDATLGASIICYCPECGCILGYHDEQKKKLITRAGEVDYSRGRYRCSRCGKDYVPVDLLNDVRDTGYTLGARMVIAQEAAGDAYATVSEGVKPEIQVSRQEVARIVSEVGQYREAEEASAVAGKLGDREAAGPLPSGDGVELTSNWREKELPVDAACCIQADGGKYRTTNRDAEGKVEWKEARVGTLGVSSEGRELPRERAGGKTYVAHTVHTHPVELMMELLAVAWMMLPAVVKALPVVFIADGGPWWPWVTVYWPRAIQILDLFHAGKHITDVAALLFGEQSAKTREWRAHIHEWLKEPGKVNQLVWELYRARPGLKDDPAKRHELRKLIAYLREHQGRMRYWEYEKLGLPLGSGGIESAVDRVITERLLERGKRWQPDNADRMLCLRAATLSGELPAIFQRRREAALDAARPLFEPLQQAA